VTRRQVLIELRRAGVCARGLQWAADALDHGVKTKHEQEALAVVRDFMRESEDAGLDSLREHVCAAVDGHGINKVAELPRARTVRGAA
jgi:hypothetical protein